MIQTTEHISVRDRMKQIWPSLTDEEIEIAQANLDRYLEVAWEVFEEVQEKQQSA